MPVDIGLDFTGHSVQRLGNLEQNVYGDHYRIASKGVRIKLRISVGLATCAGCGSRGRLISTC